MRLLKQVFGEPCHEYRDGMAATFALPCLTTQQLPTPKKSKLCMPGY